MVTYRLPEKRNGLFMSEIEGAETCTVGIPAPGNGYQKSQKKTKKNLRPMGSQQPRKKNKWNSRLNIVDRIG